MKQWTIAVFAAVVASGVAAAAHHSISSVYDSHRRLTIDGVVVQFQLINPHPFLTVDVADGNGGTERWRLEMDNRSELVDIGVTARTLLPGDRVTVAGNPGRTQPHTLYMLRLDRAADGFWYEQVGNSPKIRPATAAR
jgi:uncharacterized protein DUF6152